MISPRDERESCVQQFLSLKSQKMVSLDNVWLKLIRSNSVHDDDLSYVAQPYNLFEELHFPSRESSFVRCQLS